MRSRRAAILLVIVTLLSLVACGGSAAGAGGGSLTVSGAWVRAKEAGGTTAAYLVIANGRSSADELVGVSAPDLTPAASLHRTTADPSGMTGMRHTESIVIPAGATVALEPGGYHVMLERLPRDLRAGDRVTLVLTFEQSGPVTVTADVRAG